MDRRRENFPAPREDGGARTRDIGRAQTSESEDQDTVDQDSLEATQDKDIRAVDLSNGRLEKIPESLLAFQYLEVLDLSRNKLVCRAQGGAANGGVGANLEELARLSNLKVLRLAGNALRCLPASLFQLGYLVHLDVSDNRLTELPQDVWRLGGLEVLRASRNALHQLPGSLTKLTKLRTLHLAHNNLTELEDVLLAMKALSLVDLQGNKVDGGKLLSLKEDSNNSLNKINLRHNLLKGNIILGNYGSLTHLDVSENSIETLDLRALAKLESIQCSRNRIVELTVNGKSLTTLIADNNKIKKLAVTSPPTNLEHLDLSHNELEYLPDWTTVCHKLKTLLVSHNELQALPEHLFCSEYSSLQTLQASYNQLASLPAVIRHIPLQELLLHSNKLTSLPANFLSASTKMRVLNLSNNRLSGIPNVQSNGKDHHLEKIYLSSNSLTDSAMHALSCCRNLRVLHAAYNCIQTLPESCITVWRHIEEIVISGNKLQCLPENIIHLPHLRVLRVHSNNLQSSPCFAKMTSLKVLDLAHNHLDRINLASLVPQQLQFLDLSCNSRLHVDPRQFQVYRAQRPMSLVDVSGQNRTCLPSTPYHEGGDLDEDPPWRTGFSETPGCREKLHVSQIRLPAFCNTEAVFGMFDGGSNSEVPNILVKAVPRILLEERTMKETAGEYMKYTMLSAHRELKDKGQKNGVCATLCHITRTKSPHQTNHLNEGHNRFGSVMQRYTMRVANVGDARAVLCRKSGTLNLTQNHFLQSNVIEDSAELQDDKPNSENVIHKLGCSAMYPLVIPDPHVTEIFLEEQDEFLVIANKRFWEVMSVDEAIQEIQNINNPILAAKRLQDMAQGYGSEENLSIVVVRFNLHSDVDQLMRELRHTIRQTKHQLSVENGDCHGGHMDFSKHHCQLCATQLCRRCLGPTHNGTANGSGFYSESMPLTNGHLKPACVMKQHCGLSVRHGCCENFPDTDRSSPSGQSDQTSECGRKDLLRKKSQQLMQWDNKAVKFADTHQSVLMHENGTKKMNAILKGRGQSPTLSNGTAGVFERRSYRDKIMKKNAVKLDNYHNGHLADEEETGSEKSGTHLSDEQFKCWEYMLEQNTQMLFNKELDTLSKSFTRKSARPTSAVLDPLWPHTESSLRVRGKALSHSSPHLSEGTSSPKPSAFLSRHFGSARSLNPITKGRFRSSHKLNGGPNAAYFGSLQRLMPYNVEYDFAVTQERPHLDSLEQDSRMQKYWGIATTEL